MQTQNGEMKLTLSELSLSAIQFLLLTLSAQKSAANIIVVAASKKEYLSLHNFFRFNTIAHQQLPYISPWGTGHYTSQIFTSQQRLEALLSLIAPRPSVIVTTLPALSQYTIEQDVLTANTLTLREDMHTDFDHLCTRLHQLGYLLLDRVEQKGEFAIRGGIIDLFAIGMDRPCRIEFFGDRIASMREFDLDSMRSLHPVHEVYIYPACEAILDHEQKKQNVQTLFDNLVQQNLPTDVIHRETEDFRNNYSLTNLTMYLPLFRKNKIPIIAYLPADCFFVFPHSYTESSSFQQGIISALEKRYAEDIRDNRPTLSVAAHFAPGFSLSKHRVIDCVATQDQAVPVYHSPTGKLQALGSTIAHQVKLTRELVDDDFTVVLLGAFKSQLIRIANILSEEQLDYRKEEDYLRYIEKPAAAGIVLASGTLEGALLLEELRLLLIPDHVLLQTKKAKAKNAAKISAEILSSFADLEKNDLVVHTIHGIGRYTEIVSLTIDGSTNEFMVISYAHNDKVYLPVDKFNTLQKYISGREEDFKPRLDSLRQKNFQARKSKAEDRAREIAEKLLRNYARRKMLKARKISSPTEEYFKFEAGFPFAETDDQLRAIEDVNNDLAIHTPMDRLICGDVGFGKTEVALRAAMRVVSDGGQVMVLAPTTILGLQHHRTFRKRFAGHGVQVGLVNRLVTKAETGEITRKFNRGEIDIIIGTHKILGLSLHTRNLVMIVIDEEQKFGVTHKESLKALKPEAHILTLSATPIPRTLHMSLMGLKDISMITEPPQDRLAVKTYVADYDERLLRHAISYEIARQGQVYFVHNRIQDIYLVDEFLQKLIPQARIVVAHGKLAKLELEQAIVDFIEQKFNILLCTTIIESGIDMPNVNTLIVDRADCFGLAQLYQLRGRVGRANRQAHAYFLTVKDESVTTEAEKRLQALATHYELGSGFRIAHKDLEIRGAGNLMGSEQSGAIASVGLDLFTSLIDREIKKLQGKKEDEKDTDLDPEIKIPVSAVIPRAYIKNQNLRLKLYKRIFSCNEKDELADIITETEDLYGPVPEEIFLLLDIAVVKMHLLALKALSLRFFRQGFFQIKLHTNSTLNSHVSNDFVMLQDNNLTILSPPDLHDKPRQMLGDLNKHLKSLVELTHNKREG